MALLAALSISCSELPTQPLRLVTVTGVILDRDGAPVEYVRVVFRDRDRIPPVLHGSVDPHFFAAPITDANGAYSAQVYEGVYSVDLLPPSGSGYPDHTKMSFRISPGEARVDYRYMGARIRGFIYGPDSSEIQGGGVYAYRYSSAGAYLGQTLAYDRGYGFKMLVPQGKYDFSVVAPEGHGIPSRDFNGYVISADTTLEFRLDGFAVSGTVTGPDGKPMQLASVRARSLRADCSMLTGLDGSYLLHLPAGRYSWTLNPPAGLSYIAARPFPSTEVAGPARYDFPMGGARWTGTVRLLPDSLPAAGYPVEADMELNRGYTYATTQTDAGGAFRLVVPSGLYDLRFWNSDASGSHWDVTGVPAAGDSTLDIILDPAAASHFLEAPALPVRLRAGALRLDQDRTPRPAPLPRP